MLVARYLDSSTRLVKRIAISSIEEPTLSVDLVTKSRRCKLIAPIPATTPSISNDCKGISGTAVLRCEGTQEVQTQWQLTSCHSGYGRSLPGIEPVFFYGFSGNSLTAQNQLDLAMAVQADTPRIDSCQVPSANDVPGKLPAPFAGPINETPEAMKEGSGTR